MTPDQWITLTSVLVAALGISATVFTQRWQSAQEERRLRDSRREERASRLLDEKRRIYSEFLTACATFEEELETRLMHLGVDEPLPDVLRARSDSRGEKIRAVPDLLSEMRLLAPAPVIEAAESRDVALRSAEWSIAVSHAGVVTGEASSPHPSEDSLRDELAGAYEVGRVTLAAMRADLGVDG